MPQTDVLRNNADLYKAIYTIVSTLAAYGLSNSQPGYFQCEYLCRLATKALIHLPIPEDPDGGLNPDHNATVTRG